MCQTYPSRLLHSHDPDYDFTDSDIHMILPYFPVLKAQDMRHSAPASRSLVTWPSQMQTERNGEASLEGLGKVETTLRNHYETTRLLSIVLAETARSGFSNARHTGLITDVASHGLLMLLRPSRLFTCGTQRVLERKVDKACCERFQTA